MKMVKQLRNFQDKVVNTVCNSREDILISAPTGCGKTFIAEMIMKRLSELNKNYNFLFVVPRIILIQQFLEELTAFNESDFDRIQAENNIGGLRYICKCDCGNEIEVLESDLFTGKVTCCEECRE